MILLTSPKLLNVEYDMCATLRDFGLKVGVARLRMRKDGDGAFLYWPLGPGLIDQSQKHMVAAIAIADMKVWAHRS